MSKMPGNNDRGTINEQEKQEFSKHLESVKNKEDLNSLQSFIYIDVRDENFKQLSTNTEGTTTLESYLTEDELADLNTFPAYGIYPTKKTGSIALREIALIQILCNKIDKGDENKKMLSVDGVLGPQTIFNFNNINTSYLNAVGFHGVMTEDVIKGFLQLLSAEDANSISQIGENETTAVQEEEIYDTDTEGTNGEDQENEVNGNAGLEALQMHIETKIATINNNDINNLSIQELNKNYNTLKIITLDKEFKNIPENTKNEVITLKDKYKEKIESIKNNSDETPEEEIVQSQTPTETTPESGKTKEANQTEETASEGPTTSDTPTTQTDSSTPEPDGNNQDKEDTKNQAGAEPQPPKTKDPMIKEPEVSEVSETPEQMNEKKVLAYLESKNITFILSAKPSDKWNSLNSQQTQNHIKEIKALGSANNPAIANGIKELESHKENLSHGSSWFTKINALIPATHDLLSLQKVETYLPSRNNNQGMIMNGNSLQRFIPSNNLLVIKNNKLETSEETTTVKTTDFIYVDNNNNILLSPTEITTQEGVTLRYSPEANNNKNGTNNTLFDKDEDEEF